ncbi:cupin domain-containing protein [Aurantivibrio plasticivorans]
MIQQPDISSLIELLGLEPHPLEGGFFRRTYTAKVHGEINNKKTPIASSIFYLLTRDAPSGVLHRNRSDIIHCYHGKGAIRYYLVSPSGQLSTVTLGWDLAAGEQLQLVVPGGYWKASMLVSGDYGLISEVVAPAFDYADHEVANSTTIQNLSKQARELLSPFVLG